MTVIAWDGTFMAADRNVNYGSMKYTTKKVFRIRDHLVGGAGCGAQIAEFRTWFGRGAVASEYPTMDEASILVVAPDRKIYLYNTTPSPCLVRAKFMAIGSGSDAAMAAMFLKWNARRAIEIAAKVCHSIGGGVDVERL